MSGSNKMYPQQNGLYSVKVNKGHEWKAFKTVRMEISVGQPYHEAEKFACTIDWALGRFENIALLVGDTIQRYNLMFDEGLKEEDAKSRSFAAGTEWIQRNIKPIIKARANIYRWNDWLNAPDYKETEKAVNTLYQTHLEFRTN